MPVRQLSVIYLIMACGFAMSIVLAHNPPLARAVHEASYYARDRGEDFLAAADDYAVKPGLAFAGKEASSVYDAIHQSLHSAPERVATAPPRQLAPKAAAQTLQQKIAAAEPSVSLSLKPPALAPMGAPQVLPDDNLPLPPKSAPPSTSAEIDRVQQRLRDSLTSDMFKNFDLFLYVSKAETGPWAQHMFVFQKMGTSLALLYDWPVSTGREKLEYDVAGQLTPSFTPRGYYELDPNRFYVKYTSLQWDQPMPHAMFFKWEKDGSMTGLAIHGATGSDIDLLGTRSSAGCIRLAPENAALLQSLIRSKYKGAVPEFAFDADTRTTSNDGMMARDANGRLEYAQGYKVLVFVENYGGENVVAALY